MNLTITIGSWLAPLLFTIAAFGWQHWMHRNDSRSASYGGDIAGAFTFLVAVSVSLLGWLVWAVLT